MIDDLRLTAADLAVLDRLAWHALTSVHAPFAAGDGPARRYQANVSVFAALDNDDQSSWDALAQVVDEGETVVIMQGDEVRVGRGWTRTGGGFGNQMVLPSADALRPAQTADAVEVVPLGLDDVDQMTALVAIAQPGPFRPRTAELGDYYGVFDEGGTLVAMAGERCRTPQFAELSAVCTHPAVRGRGLGAVVTRRVAARMLERGQVPVLHVAHGNDNAQRVYERLGFVVRRVVSFTAVQRNSSAT